MWRTCYSRRVSAKRETKNQPANTRPANAISLHGITPRQAIAAALRVNPADIRALEEKERAEKSRKK